MQYLKYIEAIVVCLVLMVSFGQAQAEMTNSQEPKRDNLEADTKAIESYWTKEKMQKAKPIPTPTVIIETNSPQAVQPETLPNGQNGSSTE